MTRPAAGRRVFAAWARNIWPPSGGRRRGDPPPPEPPARFRDWTLQVVGLLRLDDPPDLTAVLRDPRRGWPVWAHSEDVSAGSITHRVRQVVQLWALRAAPAGCPVWAGLDWRPGRERSEMALFGWERGSAQLAHQVLAGGLLLLTHTQRRGADVRPDAQLYGRLCAAWARVAAQAGGVLRQAEIAAEVGRDERTVRRWIARVRRSGYPFPPPPNTGREMSAGQGGGPGSVEE
jgi:hypothetical protein